MKYVNEFFSSVVISHACISERGWFGFKTMHTTDPFVGLFKQTHVPNWLNLINMHTILKVVVTDYRQGVPPLCTSVGWDEYTNFFVSECGCGVFQLRRVCANKGSQKAIQKLLKLEIMVKFQNTLQLSSVTDGSFFLKSTQIFLKFIVWSYFLLILFFIKLPFKYFLISCNR